MNTFKKYLLGLIGLFALSTSLTLAYLYFKPISSTQLNNKITETKIVIYGDSRSNQEIHKKVVSQIIKNNPLAVFHVGDLVDDPKSNKEWGLVTEVLKPIQDNSLLFVAAGNHEKESQKYYDNFILPGNEKWYLWETDNALFLVLNTNLDLDVNSEQYQWLEKSLTDSPSNKFIIVITHHPFLSVGKHAGEKNNFSDDVNNLLVKYKVAAVFSGHDHNYERFFINNINHVIAGAAGAPLYDQKSDSQYLQRFVKAYNFCLLTIKDNKISVVVFDENGQEIDQFEINK